MALINYIIPTSNAETLRDKIGTILALELARQKALTGNTLFDAPVYVERGIAFDETEIPAINVVYGGARMEMRTHAHQVMDNEFLIYAFANSNEVGTSRGDVLAQAKLKKLLYVIRYILESMEYITLDMQGILNHKEVSEIKIFEPNNPTDADNIIGGLVRLSVRMNEEVSDVLGVTFEHTETAVKLEESDKGYKVKLIN